jgi:hypothetical protein
MSMGHDEGNAEFELFNQLKNIRLADNGTPVMARARGQRRGVRNR